jgi:hypothetical protein
MGSSGATEAGSAAIAALAGTKTVLLRTRKRDGSWVPTPVSVVADGDRAYFRTWDTSGKSKRLRNFPQVRLAPSTLRGRPAGPEVEGVARQLDGAEAQRARALLAKRFPVMHGKLVPWFHRRKGWSTVHYEITFPSPSPSPMPPPPPPPPRRPARRGFDWVPFPVNRAGKGTQSVR